MAQEFKVLFMRVAFVGLADRELASTKQPDVTALLFARTR